MSLKAVLSALALSVSLQGVAQNYVSKVWVSDNADGTYRNPILYADYSDPDVCAVGEDYYMTASSFNCLPGLPLLHSKDLVNWSLVGHAIPEGFPADADKPVQHGAHVWAPCIRYHEGEFYIFWGDPDNGAFYVKAANIAGPWTQPVCIKSGKGIIDTAPLWDDDGRVYLVHAYAGSRAQIKSVLSICELNPETLMAQGQSRIVFDGHGDYPICEGPKFYKRDGWYYIFFPAGGVPTGFQAVARSRSVYGPYEARTVLHQGSTDVNGPHQGGWVETTEGESWFIHFQDVGAYGRITHLEPMTWSSDGWPLIGVDIDNDGIGEPVKSYRKPAAGPICTPQESDEFNGFELSPQWQWQSSIKENWAYFAGDKGFMRLYSYPMRTGAMNLWEAENVLLQKTPAPQFSATTKLTFTPSSKYKGDRAGLVVMGYDYAALVLDNAPEGLMLRQVECNDVREGSAERVHASVPLKTDHLSYPSQPFDCIDPSENVTVYLRVRFSTDFSHIPESVGGVDLVVKCHFSYSLDGKRFKDFGKDFQARESKSIGAKVGLFCSRPDITSLDAGFADVDWFRIDR